jgi:hypothetical protein
LNVGISLLSKDVAFGFDEEASVVDAMAEGAARQSNSLTRVFACKEVQPEYRPDGYHLRVILLVVAMAASCREAAGA